MLLALSGTTLISLIKKRITISSQIQLIENQVAQRLQLLQSSNISEEQQIPRNISDHKIFGELKEDSALQTKVTEAPKVNTDFRLVGTFLDEADPLAIIMNAKTNEQDVFFLGSSVFEEAKLINIKTDFVEIERNSQKEILYLDEGGAPTTASEGGVSSAGGIVKVDAKKLDEALDNLPELLTQARAVPYFQNGQSVGLRLFAIKKGSMFDEIGLKNGDILKDINGSSLADITQAIKLFERLREEKSINLNLERGKSPVAYQYEIN